MRRTEQPRATANAFTSVVLATPGTPSSSRCPRASKATNKRSTGDRSPMKTSATALRTSLRACCAPSNSSVLSAKVTLALLVDFHLRQQIHGPLVEHPQGSVRDIERAGAQHRNLCRAEPPQQAFQLQRCGGTE